MSTFVLVHGVGHGAWCWERTRRDLLRAGHEVVALDLPLTALEDDAAAVAEALDELGRAVVLVGHSYGGLVISKAAARRDDVAHLVYVAAVLLDGDDVFAERALQFPAADLQALAAISADGMIEVSEDAAVTCFYNACDEAVARDAAARMRPTALACLATPSGGEPWREVPSTYLLCERDRAVHPELQRWMSVRTTRTLRFDTDHSPFLSTPERFLDVLLECGASSERIDR